MLAWVWPKFLKVTSQTATNLWQKCEIDITPTENFYRLPIVYPLVIHFFHKRFVNASIFRCQFSNQPHSKIMLDKVFDHCTVSHGHVVCRTKNKKMNASVSICTASAYIASSGWVFPRTKGSNLHTGVQTYLVLWWAIMPIKLFREYHPYIVWSWHLSLQP